jgi:D-alanyl-D-alanine carboxypeptidase/D-alanyl-D-alanine-endopeptidase (penicillin-binding protein 4)
MRALRHPATTTIILFLSTAIATIAAADESRIDELSRAFKRTIDERLAEPRYQNLEIGILIATADGEHRLYQRHPDRLQIPASTIKVISSGVALVKLGSKRRFETPLLTDGQTRQGVLHGNLYLVGRGDPTLTLSHLQNAAAQLKRAGITRISGDLVYDVSFLDEEKPRFPPNARHLYSPPCALTVNYNWIVLDLDDGPPTRLTPIPLTSYAKLDYSITISGSIRPGKPRMTYREQEWGDLYTINGTVTRWDKRYKYLRLCVSRPGLYTATLLKEALHEHGVELAGKLSKGAAPATARTLLSITGEPLVEAIRELNQESNNVVAELVNKDLGAYASSAPGTRAKGLTVLRRYCRDQIGFPAGSFTLADASGLSTANRLSAAQLNQALSHLFQAAGMSFVEALAPQGHHPHALSPKPPSHVRLFVKSGTLPITGVNAVAGYIFLDRSGEVLTFAVLIHRPKQGPPLYSGTLTNPITAAIVKAVS